MSNETWCNRCMNRIHDGHFYVCVLEEPHGKHNDGLPERKINMGDGTCDKFQKRQRKPTTSTANKEAAARKEDLQRMIDESDPKKPGKKYSCYVE